MLKNAVDRTPEKNVVSLFLRPSKFFEIVKCKFDFYKSLKIFGTHFNVTKHFTLKRYSSHLFLVFKKRQSKKTF